MTYLSSSQEPIRTYNQDMSLAPMSKAFGSFFLGSNGENTDILLSFITKALQVHQTARIEHNKDQTSYITEEHKRSIEYEQAQEVLSEKFTQLVDGLRKYSTPFHAVHFQANMVADSTIPSLLGYISGLLYNQNNCSYDGSPFTTLVEVEVTKKLINMLGFPQYQSLEAEENTSPYEIRSWAHLTIDGTVANIEALWSARNAKFYPLAVRKALDEDEFFADVREEIYVRTAKNGLKKRVIDCSAWELLNIPCDETLRLTRRVYDKMISLSSVEVTLDGVYARIQSHSLQENGMLDTYEYLATLDDDDANPIKTPVCFGPATLHYSLPKAMSLLGLGKSSFRTVKIDKDTRQDLADLTRQLTECLKTKTPVMAVVLVLGTTCEGAIDPLADVLKLRKIFRQKHGMDFNIHVDTAFGGYFSTVTRFPTDVEVTPSSLHSMPVSLSKYVAKQYSMIGKADTLTIDPHKAGFVPFAVGVFIQRNHLLKRFLTFKATYITDSPIGLYGIEGSKAGAPACSVWLTHECIPLNRLGHGALLSSCLYSAKRLYAHFLDLDQDLPFKVTCLVRLPEEKTSNPDPERVREQRDRVVNEIARKSNEELSHQLSTDSDFLEFFNEVGPDLSILSFHFNFKDPKTGNWNQSLKAANKFNNHIYLKMKPYWDGVNLKETADIPLFIGQNKITKKEHGAEYFSDMCDRMGCDVVEEDTMVVLRSIMLKPFFAETSSSAFVVDQLKRYAYEVLAEL